ncbi:MAG: hypothetical protein SFV21_21910 [Rhodospirillaceae bacterium]|nr:hypothetical protein [Rhodospirillaceae bacterium]
MRALPFDCRADETVEKSPVFVATDSGKEMEKILMGLKEEFLSFCKKKPGAGNLAQEKLRQYGPEFKSFGGTHFIDCVNRLDSLYPLSSGEYEMKLEIRSQDPEKNYQFIYFMKIEDREVSDILVNSETLCEALLNIPAGNLNWAAINVSRKDAP